MTFDKEKDFEDNLVTLLSDSLGWKEGVLMYPTEEDLIKNWANILFENNRGIDLLNEQPLTNTEMKQILEQVETLRTPFALNGFINGRSVQIVRDNPNDELHFGKEVSLRIYDRNEIAGGKSRYQIARQPQYTKKCPVLQDRRGDVTLLINGMPVIHVELKRSDTPISKATRQIEEYSHEGIFTGLFSLVQVFVAMTPEETLYFANPGPEGKFNSDFYFHWADFNNNPINDWQQVASTLLSIPMAHQLIGFYTVADQSDGILKVMRSYQYHATSRISDRVREITWGENNLLGGYIWHTTGSGKTMTSFKSAQLIAESKKADKVVFMVDRIDLALQSALHYKGFADHESDVAETIDSEDLIVKLKSDSHDLIVTSIQKMSNIEVGASKKRDKDIEAIRKKHIVIIVDECHRDTFGDMLITIKNTFPEAILFGFTGTPIDKENQKKMNTTATVFGNELHRYTLAHAIPDHNVLGFDPYKVMTYKDKDLRNAVALDKCKAHTVEEAVKDKAKAKIYYRYMQEVKMAGDYDENGQYVRGIEDEIPTVQYETEEHRKAVVQDIKENWMTLSRDSKFHAMLATSSIWEAIEYYHLFRAEMPSLKVTALFDPSDNHDESSIEKIDGLKDIITDYNERYGMKYSISRYKVMREDISARMSHKEPYIGIHSTPEEQIDLLIVVDQMLTGFDSKWVNTLYMDKVLQQEHLIQAFSRTNRLFGPDKPFGTIRYYRRPHTMERYVAEAVKHYSGDRPQGLFVERLGFNITKLNHIYNEIKDLFSFAHIPDFSKLPDDKSEKTRFAKLFNELNRYLEAAKIQGFRWEKSVYGEEMNVSPEVSLDFDEQIYDTLLQRYKELASSGGSGGVDEIPFDIKTYIVEKDTGVIDAHYMNTRFEKWLKVLRQPEVTEEERRETLDELHSSFSTLTPEEQNFAYVFLHDVESGDITLMPGKTLRDYIAEYRTTEQDKCIHRFVLTFGLDEKQLRKLILLAPTLGDNLNLHGRFDELAETRDNQKTKEYFEEQEGKKILPFFIRQKFETLLEAFIRQDRRTLELFNIASKREQTSSLDLPGMSNVDKVNNDPVEEPCYSMVADSGGDSDSTELILADWIEKEQKDDAAYIVPAPSDVCLIGCIRDIEHFKWIFRKKTYNIEKALYNVRQGDRHGAVKRTADVVHAQYAILYNLENPQQYIAYRLTDKHSIWDEDKMSASRYINPHGTYYIYQLGEQVTLPQTDIPSLLENAETDRGVPLYIRWDEVAKR